jgi:periplasmic divalent cation tolerance protein
MGGTGEVVVLITTSSSEEAQRIAHSLLNHRKAACVNIVPGVNSLFWWKGKIDSAQECLLVVKTKASALDQVISLVKQTHSYKVPEVVALPIVGGNDEYLEWIRDEVEGS